jgi:hypothetical protein
MLRNGRLMRAVHQDVYTCCEFHNLQSSCANALPLRAASALVSTNTGWTTRFSIRQAVRLESLRDPPDTYPGAVGCRCCWVTYPIRAMACRFIVGSKQTRACSHELDVKTREPQMVLGGDP